MAARSPAQLGAARLREQPVVRMGAHVDAGQLVLSLPAFFQVGAELVSGKSRALLNADIMGAEYTHVGSDRELPVRLPLLPHLEPISARVLSLLKSQVPNLHKIPFRSGRDGPGLNSYAATLVAPETVRFLPVFLRSPPAMLGVRPPSGP